MSDDHRHKFGKEPGSQQWFIFHERSLLTKVIRYVLVWHNDQQPFCFNFYITDNNHSSLYLKHYSANYLPLRNLIFMGDNSKPYHAQRVQRVEEGQLAKLQCPANSLNMDLIDHKWVIFLGLSTEESEMAVTVEDGTTFHKRSSIIRSFQCTVLILILNKGWPMCN